MLRWLCALSVVFLFGCQPSRTELVAANDAPAAAPDYRAPVAAYIDRYMVNANALRDVKIGQPFAGKANGRSGEIVCVELNAKNRAGKYTGSKRIAFLIQNETVVDSDYQDPICHDQQLAAWPEMDANAGAAAASDKAKGAPQAAVGH